MKKDLKFKIKKMYEKMKKVLKVELIKNRHIFKNVDIDGYIYDEIRNIRDLDYMKNTVKISIDWLMKKYEINDYMDLELDLYVTGLTVALIEVINFCNLYGVGLVLYHYDKLLDIYYRQDVYLDN